MAYRMAPALVTLNDLEGDSPVAGFFKCILSNICALLTRVTTVRKYVCYVQINASYLLTYLLT